MQNLISTKLLGGHMDPTFYGPFMAPYFAVHLKYARPEGDVWAWSDAGAVEECLASTWDMLGKWLARRAVTVDQAEFNHKVPAVIARLARALNRHKARSLGDVAQLDSRPYAAVLSAVHEAVLDVAKLKPTRTPEPMFGSKVVHHYFPSVVPVFDSAMVRNGAMRVKAFDEFLGKRANPWLVWCDVESAGGKSALDFHRFLSFCAAQVGEAPKRTLAVTRRTLAIAVSDFAPVAMANDSESYLWCLDAKLAEFCACGQAVAEGHLDGPTTRWTDQSCA